MKGSVQIKHLNHELLKGEERGPCSHSKKNKKNILSAGIKLDCKTTYIHRHTQTHKQEQCEADGTNPGLSSI